jgi:hypothetical protein
MNATTATAATTTAATIAVSRRLRADTSDHDMPASKFLENVTATQTALDADLDMSSTTTGVVDGVDLGELTPVITPN